MRIRTLQLGLALSCGLLAVSAQTAIAEKPANNPFADADHVVYTFPQGTSQRLPKATNLALGDKIYSPKVVFLFWGPNFNNAASPDYSYARTLQAFRNQLGSTGEWKVLYVYYQIQYPVNLGSGAPDWFDSSTPPTNVTDSVVQSEVNKYLSSHAFDSSTIYEVVTPKTSYSSSGTSTSCGGPSLAYCAYHGEYNGFSGTVKYSIQPYPSCSGCKVSGWTDAQNQEHLVHGDTCSAATDPAGNGTGACDKCVWSPAPFLDGGYGYQYTWTGAMCIQKL